MPSGTANPAAAENLAPAPYENFVMMDAEDEVAADADTEGEPAEYPWFLSLPVLAAMVVLPVGGIAYCMRRG